MKHFYFKLTNYVHFNSEHFEVPVIPDFLVDINKQQEFETEISEFHDLIRQKNQSFAHMVEGHNLGKSNQCPMTKNLKAFIVKIANVTQ